MANTNNSLNLQQFSPISPNKFYSIADYLLNSVQLIIANQPYRINEIEFYLTNTQHDDPYSHCHQDQLTLGKWYFHRYDNGSYKGGTYKGMDITLGNGSDSYCGVLIRAISPIVIGSPHKKMVINGPCRTVNHILDQLGYGDSVALMTNFELFDVTDNRVNLVLMETDSLTKESIYQGPRVGLRDSKCPEFRALLYRYVIRPDYLSREHQNSLIKVIPSKAKVVLVDD
jgi:3-methyladenine DNA glycosylase Mpg